eukprot:GHVT01053631.1.p2 GENE.GHVT01053631.1~~GHVT01053631.1.p2  ORF type:complete len:104 (-),score=0.28 GHVT01053631.1:110-421(-)
MFALVPTLLGLFVFPVSWSFQSSSALDFCLALYSQFSWWSCCISCSSVWECPDICSSPFLASWFSWSCCSCWSSHFSCIPVFPVSLCFALLSCCVVSSCQAGK